MRDLIVLVPDKNTEYTVRGAIARPRALGIRELDCQVIVHPERDGGARRTGVQLLRLQRRQFRFAVLLFDYEGCGSSTTPAELEADLDAELQLAWGSHAKAIVVEPEVDVWMWGADVHLRAVAGWEFAEGIRDWLQGQGCPFDERGKPTRPKEALEAVFRRTQVSRSSAHYEQLASRLSLRRCEDAAFRRLSAAFREWFPSGQA
jgi:hypothetical protein